MKKKRMLYRHVLYLPGLVVEVHGTTIDGKRYIMSFYRNPGRVNTSMLRMGGFRNVENWVKIY